MGLEWCPGAVDAIASAAAHTDGVVFGGGLRWLPHRFDSQPGWGP